MSNTFIIGDPHLGHWKNTDQNIMVYSDRPFDFIEEHDEIIIGNWNEVVKSKDTVIINGDFALTSVNKTKEYLSRLNGKKIMVLGDHDKQIWQCREYFEEITKYHTLTYNNKFIVIFHWCIRAWQRSHYNSYHLFSHSHGTLPPIGKSWDVGVDTECKEIGHKKFYPYHMDEILQIMDLRPNNPNYIKDRGKVKRCAKVYWKHNSSYDAGVALVRIDPCCDELPINPNVGLYKFTSMKYCYKCGKPIKFIEVKE